MEYVIGGLLLLVVLVVFSYIVRKKLFKEVDRLETWKMDIVNRPVLDEMSRVKQLNMTGETEALFESWRASWDDIVTSELPKIEEYLFDADEYIDRFRFGKAKQVHKLIEKQLDETENKIKELLIQINELVGSEEKNRLEIEELKTLYRDRRKTLLAHRHNFGRAEAKLEETLDEVVSRFHEFEDKTANGDYLQAREIVLSIHHLMQMISEKMEAIPNLIIECQTSLPNQLQELKDGYREMLDKGYPLEHLQMETEIQRLLDELVTFTGLIENADTEKLHEGIEQVKAGLDDLYDLLENEVEAKQFIIENEDSTRSLIFSAKEENSILSFELQQVQQSYQISRDELVEQQQFEKQLTKLSKRFELLQHKILSDDMALTVLKDELTDVKTELEAIVENQRQFQKKLHTLRKDEMTARETVMSLSKTIANCIRLVNKSNIPGLPEEYRFLLEEAREGIGEVKAKLEEKPLNIVSIQQYLELAVLSVDKLHEETTQLLETVMLSEKVIQYGNRYRNKYPAVRKALSEAEQSFRSYNYQAALKVAATSLEEVEPGALKRIEHLLQETIEV